MVCMNTTRCRACATRNSVMRKVGDIRNYIMPGKLWEAFASEQRAVLLIDEIDKADIEFPNDLLRELDRMDFFVYETRETIRAKHRPIVIITSNNEKELPDAFLRRCFFHYIRFPDAETLTRIVDSHYPGIKRELVNEALQSFFNVREAPSHEEEAEHIGIARLDQAAGGRGHSARGAA
jgi:MoxR-like ATPase